MADSLAPVLQSTALNQPRAYLSGLPHEEMVKLQARLPNLVDVREEAGKAMEKLKEPPPTNVSGYNQDGEYLGILHPAIAYHFTFPKLTLFSYFCCEEDVPDDLQAICLWALKQRLWALKEGPDEQLNRSMLRDSLTRKVEPYAKTYMEYQTLSKLTSHLLSARIDLPQEAVPLFDACLKLEGKLNPTNKDPFLRNPRAYTNFGAALARTKSRNTEAKPILERVINDIDKVTSNDAKVISIQAKLYLARVLRRMGELEEAKKHETYLIKWFKKNPNKVGAAALEEWFLTENEDDPVFEGLGGMNWLRNRKMTWKSVDRSARACYYCGVREGPTKKMLRCSKCQYMFYCSKECQSKDFPFHKVSCLEYAEALKHVQLMKSISPETGRCVEDWHKYRSYDYDHALIHALGLTHDPKRGLTHILIKSVKYVPNGRKDVVDRFEVVAAGVFTISDVLTEMDSLMNYNPGEAKQAVDEYVENFNRGMDRKGTRFACFSLLFSEDKNLSAYLSTGYVTKERLIGMNHNPKWRSLLNPGKNVTVKGLILQCGAKDAEFDYIQSQTSQSTSPSDPSGIVATSSSRLESEDQLTQASNQTRTSRAFAAEAALPGLRGMFNRK